MTNGHPYEDADYDLYALGALRGEECAAIESHVASCAKCAHKLAEARGRIALLALSVDPVQPAPGVKESLMRQLNASAEGHETWQRVEEPRRSFFSGGWLTAIWAPAALALALVTIFLWVQNKRQASELDELYGERARLQQPVEQAQALLDLFTARDTIHVALQPSREVRGTTASVIYNARLGKIFYNDTLNAAPPDKSYQLWLVPTNGDPISAGVLTPTPGTTGTQLLTKVPAGTTAKAFAVTVEPPGGSPQPTGPKLLLGGV
jgi:anti-sigma-K factor RskA